MQWTSKERQEPTYPTEWRRCFAFLPIKFGNTWVWLEHYEYRDTQKPEAGKNYFLSWGEARLPREPEEVWEMRRRIFVL